MWKCPFLTAQKLWRSSLTKRNDGNSESPGAFSTRRETRKGKPHLGVLLSTLLAERQREIVSNIGGEIIVRPVPPARPRSAPGSRPSSPPTPTVDTKATGSRATAANPAVEGVGRSQVGRVKRQVDELMAGIRPSLLAWIRSAV